MNRISPAAPFIPTIFWLLCDRCVRAFYTNTFRSCCDPCQDAAAAMWPGVIEPMMAVSGC